MQKKIIVTSAIGGLLLCGSLLSNVTVSADEKLPSNYEVAQKPDLKATIGTGWSTSFKEISHTDPGLITVKTKATMALNAGIGAQYKSQIGIDEDIANQLFSVSNWQDYVTGTISRPNTFWTRHTTTFEDGFKKGKGNDDGIWYDITKHRLVYQTPSSLLDIGVAEHIDWNLYIDMDKFHHDYPTKLVTSKRQYAFSSETYSSGFNIDLIGGETTAYIDHYDNQSWDWVEGEVKPTTLSVDDDLSTVSGTADESNADYDSYTIELAVNGQIVASDIKLTDDKKWSYDVSKLNLKSGDVISARVIGYLKAGNTASSTWADLTVGDSVPYANWKVKEGDIVSPLDGDTSVLIDLPEQNHDFDRTYSYILKVNGNEVKTGDYDGHALRMGINEDTALKKGDLVSLQIIGHQDKEEDKNSEIVQQEVAENDSYPYDSWNIQAAQISPIYDGDVSTTIMVPAQEQHNRRTYSLETYVNGKLLNTKSIKSSGDTVTVFNTDTTTGNITSFKAGDVIKTVVVGHQDSEDDKLSGATEVTVKASAQSITGQDVTAYVGDAVPEDSAFKASATDKTGKSIAVSIDKSKVDMSKAGDYDVTITSADGQTKVVKVHVKAREGITKNSFSKAYWQSYGMVYEGKVSNSDWDQSDKNNFKEIVNIVNESGQVVLQEEATPTNFNDSSKYDGFQFIINNEDFGKLSNGLYHYELQVTYKGKTYTPVTLLNKEVGMLGSSLYHNNYTDMESTVIYENSITPILSDNTPEFKVAKQDSANSIIENNVYFTDNMDYAIDGYINLENTTDLSGYNKELVVTNSSGQVVYSRENLPTVSTNWVNTLPINVSQTFQAIIPQAYTTTTEGVKQGDYTYTINVKDASGNVIATRAFQ